jgi:hypothetical protein
MHLRYNLSSHGSGRYYVCQSVQAAEKLVAILIFRQYRRLFRYYERGTPQLGPTTWPTHEATAVDRSDTLPSRGSLLLYTIGGTTALQENLCVIGMGDPCTDADIYEFCSLRNIPKAPSRRHW